MDKIGKGIDLLKEKWGSQSIQESKLQVKLAQSLPIPILAFIIWVAPWVGTMNQILRCDWLPERARWSYLARSGLPAVSRKKNFLKSHIINPLLIKLVRSRWLDIGLFFFRVYVSVHKHAKKERQYPAIQPSWPHSWSITHIYIYILVCTDPATDIYQGACSRVSRAYISRRMHLPQDLLLRRSVSPCGFFRAQRLHSIISLFFVLFILSKAR